MGTFQVFSLPFPHFFFSLSFCLSFLSFCHSEINLSFNVFCLSICAFSLLKSFSFLYILTMNFFLFSHTVVTSASNFLLPLFAILFLFFSVSSIVSTIMFTSIGTIGALILVASCRLVLSCKLNLPLDLVGSLVLIPIR